MKGAEIPRLRLHQQRLTGTGFSSPAAAVSWFGAVQAQDYLGALWALGLRTRDASEGDAEAAEARREIVRTWPLRGTLHFVAAEDVRWLTQLSAPRVIARHWPRWAREYDLDERVLARADERITRALQGGRRLKREELYAALEAGRISTAGSRGLHLLLILSLRGRLCLAGRVGRQHSFALLDEWIPRSRRLEGEEAYAELARRYFTSHGPATLKDFMWWAGLTARQAGAALAAAGSTLTRVTVDGAHYWWQEPPKRARPAKAPSQVWLLPAYDEFTVAYQDRSLLVPGRRSASGMPLLNPVVLVDGAVVGTWRRELRRKTVQVAIQLWQKLNARQMQALQSAQRRYADFLGCETAGAR